MVVALGGVTGGCQSNGAESAGTKSIHRMHVVKDLDVGAKLKLKIVVIRMRGANNDGLGAERW